MGGSSEDFALELIAKFSKLYNDDLEGSSILGFINKKLVLITFLANLTNLGNKVRYENDKDFITTELCDKWRPWFEEKLLSYEESCRKWVRLNHSRNRTTSQPKINRLSDKLNLVEQKLRLLSAQLNLETQVYERIQSEAETQEDEQRRKRNCIITLGIVLGLTGSVIYFFREPIWEASINFISAVQRQVRSSTNWVDPTPTITPTTTPTITPTTTPTITPTTTPTPTITPTIIGYDQGWMFIGKLTRSSSGDDILDPPTIYPRMIPQSGAIVEVIEITNIRFGQPQAPDFDHAQQEILGCVVPGEEVKILQVEILPNRAVWARVQKEGVFLPRCPSNGIRAWW